MVSKAESFLPKKKAIQEQLLESQHPASSLDDKAIMGRFRRTGSISEDLKRIPKDKQFLLANIYSLDEVIEYITEFSVDQQQLIYIDILNRTADNDDYDLIACNQALLQVNRLDCILPSLAEHMVESGIGGYAAQSCEKLYGISPRELAQLMVEHQKQLSLVYHLDQLFPDNDREFRQFIEQKSVKKLFRFREFRIGDVIQTYIIQQRFQGLYRLMQLCNDVRLPFGQEAAEKKLQLLVRQKDFLAADGFIHCMRYSHLNVDVNLAHSITEGVTMEKELRTKRKERTLDESTYIILDEAHEFYIHESILAELAKFEQQIYSLKMRNQEERLPFRFHVDFFDLRRGIEDDMERQFQWMKEYITYAVCTELNFDGYGFVETQLLIPAIQEAEKCKNFIQGFLSYATEEELRGFLKQAQQSFTDYNRGDFGGVAWKQIAEVAEECWQPHGLPYRISLMDRMFDLQHNNGSVFDKDKERIKVHQSTLESFLDMKRHAQHLETLLEQSEQMGLSLSKKMQARLEQLRALQKIVHTIELQKKPAVTL